MRVAQLDRASDYGSEGQEFESSHARLKRIPKRILLLYLTYEQMFVKIKAMDRHILHSDMNSFFASVEMALDPSLAGRAVAVCGSAEDRHGIVLAKSELAKKAGVTTGMPNWQAASCCPGLIIVHPHYDQYVAYSKRAQAIYCSYTDRVEPFGMDECWLDVTGALERFDGSSMALAGEIRHRIKDELGLTVSIGVSFNKAFAKLGSDMKKPDAITCISRENFKEKVWPLPASDILFVGRATKERLRKYGIKTIGDMAAIDPELMKKWFGVHGSMLSDYARGLDNTPVALWDSNDPVKSVGHGVTCVADLTDEEEVWRVILELSQDVGHKLRAYGLMATSLQVVIRDSALDFYQYQGRLQVATASPMIIARRAREIFAEGYRWPQAVRAVTVRAVQLIPADTPVQQDLFTDRSAYEKQERIDRMLEQMSGRYGSDVVKPASLFRESKMPGCQKSGTTLPGHQ